VLLKFDNGAAGVLMASQVAAGEENALRIRIYGEKGGMEWSQQEPNSLIVKWLDQPTQIFRAGVGYKEPLSSFTTHNLRTPGGHPEGYLEAFGNIYRNFAQTLTAHIDGTKASPESLDFPGVEDGIRGMAFIDSVVASSQSKEKWYEHKVQVGGNSSMREWMLATVNRQPSAVNRQQYSIKKINYANNKRSRHFSCTIPGR
jgi:predicted dehydrogenase